tara:strand:- start:1858 stop:2745 length:888 start_codon:yes stop_codon:yes gene_type:complete
LGQKSWQGNAILALLGAAVLIVAAMAVNDTRRTADKTAPPPTNRTISDLELPDLSVSGFRVGNLAVSLVNNLFSSTRSLLTISDAPSTTTAYPQALADDHSANSTTTTVKTAADSTPPRPTIQPTSTSLERAATIRTTSTTNIEPDSSSPTSTVAATLTTTSIAPTTTIKQTPLTTTTSLPPVSDQPFEESLEPENNLVIFGQPYLATWPTLEMWERMAWCESRNTWDVDTGNGYYGGLQFALGSWQWMGGEGSPADATKEEQIYRANLLWQAQGWNGWPGCKAYFGWSRWQILQ